MDKPEYLHLPKVLYNFDKMFSTINEKLKSNKYILLHTPQPIDNGQITFKLLSSIISPQPQPGVGQITP